MQSMHRCCLLALDPTFCKHNGLLLLRWKTCSFETALQHGLLRPPVSGIQMSHIYFPDLAKQQHLEVRWSHTTTMLMLNP